MFESRIRGKRLLGVGMVLTLLVAIGIWQVSVRTGQAQSVGSFNGLKVIIAPGSLTGLTSLAAGTSFYREGPISEVSGRSTTEPFFQAGDQVGTWRMWGVSGGNGVLVVNMNLELGGFGGLITAQGTLFNVVTSGLEPTDDLIAITGGAGAFRGATGEASVIRQSDGTIVFRLLALGSRH
ncbi:MAG: hypothetical protein V7641_2307 [Blastocatellia bacterium]